MKKIFSVALCAVLLLGVCSCAKDSGGTYKEPEDYKKASSKGYTIKYDDNVFDYVKTDEFDYLILKSVKDENPTDYTLTISKEVGKTTDEVAAEIEKEFEENGFFEISADASQTFGEKAKCVSALADEGETIYESQTVPFDGGVFRLDYHFSTSLDSVAVEDTIYSIISSFEIK